MKFQSLAIATRRRLNREKRYVQRKYTILLKKMSVHEMMIENICGDSIWIRLPSKQPTPERKKCHY